MASILHRGPGQYRVQIRRKGTNLCKTFETRKAAEEWAAIVEGKVVGGEKMERQQETATLRQACEWMRDHVPDTLNGKKNILPILRYWGKSKFADWALDSIHAWDLETWVKESMKAGASPQNTIHRLNTLSKLYDTWGRAHRVKLENPVKRGIRPTPPKGRDRRLHPDEEERLLAAADKTRRPWLKPAIIIALETAMRQSEQFGVEWSQINFEQGYLDLFRTKNGRARRVPLSVRALEAYAALRHHPRPVPVQTVGGLKMAFKAVQKTGEFPDLRWHDLRHEAISRLFENTDLRDMEIMAISGHLNVAMLMRYSHLRSHKLADRLPGGKLNRRT